MRIRCLLLPLGIAAVHLFVQLAAADQPADGSLASASSLAASLVSTGDQGSSSIFQPVSVLKDNACGCDDCGGCDDCCGGCDSVASCGCDSGCCSCKLLGVFAPSDHCFDEFISPMTNPVFFEDPRTLTEARYIYLNQKIPPALGGDTVQLHAVQIRAALSDRLSVIATKDGYIVSRSPLLEDGWADVALGVKYNLLADPCCQRLVSVGVTYEMPVGSTCALQGNGDGEWHAFVTGGTEFGRGAHWITAAGLRLASSPSESEMFYWSNHFDRKLFGNVYGLAEVNWYHWISSGTGGIAGIEGGDLINLGSTGVTDKDIVTGALGLKLKPSKHMEIGLAWEIPLTDERDLIEDRFTFDWIFRY
jgi:hypothetical protein